MSLVTLHIDGMSCGHCLNAVNRALSSVPGAAVQRVQMGHAEVAVDAAASTAVTDAIVAAVEAAGYHATVVAPG